MNFLARRREILIILYQHSEGYLENYCFLKRIPNIIIRIENIFARYLLEGSKGNIKFSIEKLALSNFRKRPQNSISKVSKTLSSSGFHFHILSKNPSRNSPPPPPPSPKESAKRYRVSRNSKVRIPVSKGDRECRGGWRIIEHRNRGVIAHVGLIRPRATGTHVFMQKSNFPTAGEKAPMDKSGVVPFEATLPVLFCNGEITITTARSMASPRLPMMFAAHFPIVSAFHRFFTIVAPLSLLSDL